MSVQSGPDSHLLPSGVTAGLRASVLPSRQWVYCLRPLGSPFAPEWKLLKGQGLGLPGLAFGRGRRKGGVFHQYVMDAEWIDGWIKELIH